METEACRFAWQGKYGALSQRGAKHVIATAGKRADVRLSANKLRRSCATWMARSGASLEAIRLQHGHVDITTTQQYLAYQQDGVDESSEVLADFETALRDTTMRTTEPTTPWNACRANWTTRWLYERAGSRNLLVELRAEAGKGCLPWMTRPGAHRNASHFAIALTREWLERQS